MAPISGADIFYAHETKPGSDELCREKHDVLHRGREVFEEAQFAHHRSASAEIDLRKRRKREGDRKCEGSEEADGQGGRNAREVFHCGFLCCCGLRETEKRVEIWVKSSPSLCAPWRRADALRLRNTHVGVAVMRNWSEWARV